MNLLFKLMMKGGAGVTPVLSASLTSAVAPFGVVFDGVGTTAPGDAFHDYIYYFDFGDGAAANYTYGQLAGTTKNRFVGGPVAAYVYETPGTYTARMWVSDGVSVWGPVTKQITVTDPDVVYAGTNTICISTSGNFTGAPAGAQTFTLAAANNFNTAVATYSGPGKRVLFRSGENFTVSTLTTIAGTNPKNGAYFGTFGGTAQATITATAPSNTMLRAGNGPGTASASGMRFHNLKFVATGQATVNGIDIEVYAVDTTDANIKNFTSGYNTIHKVTFEDLHLPIQMGGVGTVISNVVTNPNGTGNGTSAGGGNKIFSSRAKRCAILDSNLDGNHAGEFSLRVQGADIFAIISNRFARPATAKAHISYRGWQVATQANAQESNYAVIASNFYDDSTKIFNNTGTTNCAPTSAASNQVIRNVIWENSFYYQVNGVYIHEFKSKDQSFRNNVILTDVQSGYTMDIIRTTAPNTSMAEENPALVLGNIRILNNTVYCLGSGYAYFLSADALNDGLIVKNNVMYAPNMSPSLIVRAGVTGTNSSISNNTLDASIATVNPLWVGPSTSMEGYKLQLGSYARNAGVDVKVRADALGFIEGPTFDMGALNAPDKQVDAWTIIP